MGTQTGAPRQSSAVSSKAPRSDQSAVSSRVCWDTSADTGSEGRTMDPILAAALIPCVLAFAGILLVAGLAFMVAR